MIMSDDKCHLRNKEGKYVTVRRSGTLRELCVSDFQNANNSAGTLLIWRRKINEKNEIAFSCPDGSKFYSPNVKGRRLELADSTDSLSESNWFKKINNGDKYYGLVSVMDPKLYLTLSGSLLDISNDDQKCAYITDEKI